MKTLPKSSSITFFSAIIVFIATSLLFAACRKEINTGKIEMITTLSEAEGLMTELVAKEKKLLELPYSQLPKNSRIRKLARMEKLAKLTRWGQSKSFFRDGLSYLVVPVNDKANPFPISSRECLRYLLFTKKKGDQIEMNIVEMYSNIGEDLGSNQSNNLVIAVENILYNENKPLEEITASIIIYDRYYYTEQSYSVKRGFWQKAQIVTEHKEQSNISSSIKLAQSSQSQSTNITGTTQSSPFPNFHELSSEDGQCTSWGMYMITYDAWGHIESEQLIYVWNECVDTNDAEAGGGNGGSSGTDGYNKTLINNITVPCISAVLNTHTSRISNFAVNAMNNENMYQPMNFSFNPSSTLPTNVSGQLMSMYINGSGVLTFDININEPTLSNSSQEKIFQTYLHETLHAVLLAKGVQWSSIVQHEAMTSFYRGLIETEIKRAFPSLSNTEAYALSWSGLQTTNAYISLSGSKHTEIEGILGDHLESSTRGGGTLC